MTVAATTKLSVYLVEDEIDLREALVYSLSQMNFAVTGFADAMSFYRAFAVARCDVVVLDVGLPGEDGFTIAAHLRAASDVGIILATARGQVPDRIHGMRAGADAYLVKPIHPEELAATLEAVGRRLRAAVPHAPTGSHEQPAKSAGNAEWHLAGGDWFLCDPQGQTLRLTTSERTLMAFLFKITGCRSTRLSLRRCANAAATSSRLPAAFSRRTSIAWAHAICGSHRPRKRPCWRTAGRATCANSNM